MKQCSETITLYNKRLNKRTGYDRYEPTIIRGVSWFCEVASTVDSSGLKTANKFTIRIPEDADFSGKTYVLPVEYPDEDPEESFTLNQGDIIVHAEADPDERMTPADLQETYGEIVTILSVTDSRKRPHARHWKVVGS